MIYAISNYAFSELNRTLQDAYIDKVINKCSNGYMVYNHITPKEFNTYTAIEFANLLVPKSQIFDETPCTFKNNRLVIWKT